MKRPESIIASCLHGLLSLSMVFLIVLSASSNGIAQDTDKKEKETASAEESKEKKDEKSGTVEIGKIEVDAEPTKQVGNTFDSQISLDGKTVDYAAAVKSIVVTKDDGKSKATIYFTEYLKKDVEDKSKRPLTFCFNGGPGSASVWLHIGGLSPKKVNFKPSELMPKTFSLDDNPDSILDLTDMVFIDPVQTGFSRPEKDDDKSKFLGLQNDIEAVGEFVRIYWTRNGRWTSPMYILGESYGGIRGPGLVHYLYERHYIETTGLILVSPVVDFQTLLTANSNDLPYVLFLPSFAATAWFHHKTDPSLGSDLPTFLKEVEKFALGRYSTALHKGDTMSSKQKQKIAETMSGMIGLSSEYLLRADLKVTMGRFGKELLREQGEVIGRYDGRFRAPTWDGNGESAEFDPSGALVSPGFSTSIRQYFFDAFKVTSEEPYEILSGKVRPWSYNSENRYVELSGRLKQAMFEMPNMRLFVACGYMDLATPYMGIHHTVDHLGLPKTYEKRVTYGHYPAGHMMYIEPQSQRDLKKDLAEFFK